MESAPRQENVVANGDGAAQQMPIAITWPQHLLLLTQILENVVLVMVLLAMELAQAKMNAAVFGVIAGLAISIAQ